MSAHLNRRQVLTGAAAIGTGLVAGSSALGGPARAAQPSYDVVVIGCGAAGMTAALRVAKRGLSVLVVEKAPTFGGSAARSGAGIWIPNNQVILAAGVPDTPAKAAAYLAAVVGGDVPTAKQQAFLDNGPSMIDFVIAHERLLSGRSFTNSPGILMPSSGKCLTCSIDECPVPKSSSQSCSPRSFSSSSMCIVSFGSSM